MQFDPKKPVQTRDGRKARIICTDKRGDYPIVALVDAYGSDRELILSYSADGRQYSLITESTAYGAASDLDLVNIPERRFALVGTRPDGSQFVHHEIFTDREKVMNALLHCRDAVHSKNTYEIVELLPKEEK